MAKPFIWSFIGHYPESRALSNHSNPLKECMNTVDFPTTLNHSTATPLMVTPMLTGIKILIVDDCDENQFLFSHLLKRKGALISTASNGHEGAQKVLNESFDIVLMDIQMPVMDGYAAIELLKKSGNQTNVVAVTASTQMEEKIKINEAGFAAYVSKPIDKDIFIQTIYDLVVKRDL